MTGKSKPARLKVFSAVFADIAFVANHQNVPVGHFSVLTEMTQMLIAPMEMTGYTNGPKL